jgi:hypothetical protein
LNQNATTIVIARSECDEVIQTVSAERVWIATPALAMTAFRYLRLSPHPSLSSPAKAGDPVRRGFSVKHVGLSGILDRPVEPGDDN